MEELKWCSRMSLFTSFLICLILASGFVHADRDDDDGGSPATPTASTPCSSQLNLGSVKLPFSTANFSCNSAWSSQGFTLMFQNTGLNLWSFVLTAPDQGGYISVGFSPTGNMVGSSAIAGWVPSGGAGVVKQYLLAGTSSSACQPDTGILKLVPGTSSIVSQSSKLYMAFQLRTSQPETKLVYAVGSAPGSNNLLPQHQSKTSTTIDYTKSSSTSGGGSSSSGDVEEGGSSSKVSSSPGASCSTNLAVSAGAIPFDTTSMKCNAAWTRRDFTLLYKQAGPALWSFVLSAPDNNGYVSVGFSRDGGMVGSSAIAGWSSSSGSPGSAKQYYLGGTSSGRCPPDQGSLVLARSPVLVSQNSRLYLAFQLNTTSPLTRLIYAVGPSGNLPGSDNLLATHDDKVSTTIDYTTGLSSSGSGTSTLKTAHGALGLLGWGVLVPLGIIAARYCKQWDPQWFYSHLGLQITGFTFGVICVLTGFSLEDKVAVEVDTHKGIGIFVLVLGCLQVMAVLARPDKAAKIRRYWNWYHHNVGRLALLFAVANIFYGLSLAHESSSWSVGFGIFLALWVILSVVLEVRMRMRR